MTLEFANDVPKLKTLVNQWITRVLACYIFVKKNDLPQKNDFNELII